MENNNISAFPQALAERIIDGKNHGVSDENMVKGMVSLGNLMTHFVKPDSPEEALMQQMWEQANEEEKYTLANMVLRLGKQQIEEQH
ncbi:hypothetical protein GGQ84_001999 [Desulfitispora alkaliphila]|uniref:DUF3243 family protein n=1 Tax=Desulfitispora alkaliphila TaxID=622674 RepID=UPI003D221C6B